jgi:hypothetical protein
LRHAAAISKRFRSSSTVNTPFPRATGFPYDTQYQLENCNVRKISRIVLITASGK